MTIRSQVSVAFALLASSSLAQSWSGGGTWSQPVDWGLMAIHLALMPGETAQDCQLVAFNRSRINGSHEIITDFVVKRIPATSSFTYPTSYSVTFDVGEGETYRELFCAGHAFLPDGRLLIAGGHKHPGTDGDSHGIVETYVLDASDWSIAETSHMWAGRWYPTVIA